MDGKPNILTHSSSFLRSENLTKLTDVISFDRKTGWKYLKSYQINI